MALERIRARMIEHADDFHLSEELAAEYFDHFEVPTLEEGPLIVISGASATQTAATPVNLPDARKVGPSPCTNSDLPSDSERAHDDPSLGASVRRGSGAD